jgi:hypothetical protein
MARSAPRTACPSTTRTTTPAPAVCPPPPRVRNEATDLEKLQKCLRFYDDSDDDLDDVACASGLPSAGSQADGDRGGHWQVGGGGGCAGAGAVVHRPRDRAAARRPGGPLLRFPGHCHGPFSGPVAHLHWQLESHIPD